MLSTHFDIYTLRVIRFLDGTNSSENKKNVNSMTKTSDASIKVLNKKLRETNGN